MLLTGRTLPGQGAAVIAHHLGTIDQNLGPHGTKQTRAVKGGKISGHHYEMRKSMLRTKPLLELPLHLVELYT